MYNKILLPLDGSSFAEYALPHALEMAQKFNAELHLLHIVTKFVPEVEQDVQRSHNLYATQAHEYMEKMVNLIQYKTKRPIVFKVVEGLVPELILEYADRQTVDLIVMATHGRTGLKRLVLGSVAERVLRAAYCPVLLVRVQADALQDEHS
jgi:nucleotide-binding universal stress UspA family protein